MTVVKTMPRWNKCVRVLWDIASHSCNAEHARKLSRQYVCSLRFSKTDFTLGDETSRDRLAVPNPSTVASHSISAQHQFVWS